MTAAAVLMAGIVLYAAAGFWIAPRILEGRLQAMLRENTGLTLAVDAVAVNPFTLTVSLDNVTLFRPQNPPVVSVERFAARLRGVDFTEESLLLRDAALKALEVVDDGGRPALTVAAASAGSLVVGPGGNRLRAEALRLERPHVHLDRTPAGTFRPAALLDLLVRGPLPADREAVALEIAGGRVTFRDAGPPAAVLVEVTDITGSVVWPATGDTAGASASLRGRATGDGTVSLSAEWLASRPRSRSRFEMRLGDFPLPRLSAYVATVIGRELQGGRLSLDLDGSLDASRLKLDVDLVTEDLRLDAAGDTTDTDFHPDTVMALLQDPGGRIELDLPVVARRLDRGHDLIAVFSAALGDYLSSLTAAPFGYLAGLAGRPGMALGRLPFPPGSAELGDVAAARLAALNRVLELRPRLGLTVFPGLNERADREALARQQILLHVNLASSAGLPGRPPPASLDFADPIVLEVLDEFANDRLSPSQRAGLAAQNPAKDTAYYHAVFEALVDNEDIGLPALARLARYRARAVADALADPDRDDDRVRLAQEIVLAPAGGQPVSDVVLEARARE